MRKIVLSNGERISRDLAETLQNVWESRQMDLKNAITKTIKDSIYLYNTIPSASYECIVNEQGDIFTRFVDRKGIFQDVHQGTAYTITRKPIQGIIEDDESPSDFIADQLSLQEYESLKKWAIENGYFKDAVRENGLIEEIEQNGQIFDLLNAWDYNRCNEILNAYLDQWYEILGVEEEATEILIQSGELVKDSLGLLIK